MRINLRQHPSQPAIRAEVDPRSTAPLQFQVGNDVVEFDLNWKEAWDGQGVLRRCPVCGCRELFARRDFPQRLGLLIVIVGGVVASGFFAVKQPAWAFVALGSVALIDAVIFPFTKRCLTCYRCRSEFRGLKIPRGYPAWDLSIGEKYRQIAQAIEINPPLPGGDRIDHG